MSIDANVTFNVSFGIAETQNQCDNDMAHAVFRRIIKAAAPNGTERRFRDDDPEQAD
jgi:hypothetical protein